MTFGQQVLQIWSFEGFLYSRALAKGFPGKTFVSHWPARLFFPGEGLWCHTAEEAASVTPKWLSLRLVLEAYMLEFGG